jgi:hypothetical protein
MRPPGREILFRRPGRRYPVPSRIMAIRQGEALNAPALTAVFKQIIANNRAGGWRKLKRGS